MANSYVEPTYVRLRIKTDISFTKMTLVFCFGLRPILCSFDFDLNQAEQKVVRVKFLFVLCCLFAQARVCRPKSEDPQLGWDSSYCWDCVGMWQKMFSMTKFSVYYVYKYSLLFLKQIWNCYSYTKVLIDLRKSQMHELPLRLILVF